MFSVTNQITSLKSFIQSTREDFDRFEKQAREKAPDAKFKDVNRRRVQRSTRITHFDGDADETVFEGGKKFRIESFLPILDSLSVGLDQRLTAYETINKRFSFIESLPDMNNVELQEHCKTIAEYYDQDLDEKQLYLECLQFSTYVSLAREECCGKTDTKNNMMGILFLKINKDGLISLFPNVEIALRIFMSMMVANATGERSFSKLSLIKNELRTTLKQERLNWLSLLSIENNLLNNLDFDTISNDFASKKCRKRSI